MGTVRKEVAAEAPETSRQVWQLGAPMHTPFGKCSCDEERMREPGRSEAGGDEVREPVRR